MHNLCSQIRPVLECMWSRTRKAKIKNQSIVKQKIVIHLKYGTILEKFIKYAQALCIFETRKMTYVCLCVSQTAQHLFTLLYWE